MKKRKTISIIIPVYNEERLVNKIINKVCQADSRGLKKEVIVVNDGSTDKSQQSIKTAVKQAKKNKQISFKLISYANNRGKGYALKQGIAISTGEIVLIQDADLEYNPDDYTILLEPFIKDDADAVYGSRFVSAKPRRVLYFWHYVANICLTTFSNILTNLNLSDMETGFKVFDGDLIRQIAKKIKSNRFGFEPEITARIAKVNNIKIYEVGISYWGRTYNEGKKIRWTDGIRTIWEILKYNLWG